MLALRVLKQQGGALAQQDMAGAGAGRGPASVYERQLPSSLKPQAGAPAS